MRAILFALALVLALPSAVLAESWCAYPLWTHEWGVQAFDARGAPRAPVGLAPYFHRSGPAPGSAPPFRARDLPADSGMRALPVLHFYSAGTLTSGPIPVGIEVGFRRGEALAWYPQVDVFRPTRLGWELLELTPAPRHRPAGTRTPWVRALRDFDALWANGRGESERFVFYEARTRERVALAVERGDRHRPGHRHYVLHNRGAQAVHDVVVTHREGGRVFVFVAPTIPAGRRAGFVLEEHAAPDLAAAQRGWLRARLVDPAEGAPPREYRWHANDCVMMRDPAVPVTQAEGHRLFAHEVDAILDVWGAAFFDAPGTTVVYREDAAYLDDVMPLGVYTDMYNFVKLRRLGLAVWTGVTLP